MKYLTFVTLLHHILAFLLSFMGLKFSITVLLKNGIFSRSFKFSPLIGIYFVFVLIYSILSILYYIYAICLWRPDETIYNAYILYWLGIGPYMLGFLGTVIEIFLCLDRCLSILFTLKYTSNHKLYCSYMAILVFIAISWLLLFPNGLLSCIPKNSNTTCITFGCFLTTVLVTPTKFSLVGTSFVGSGILYYLIRRFLKTSPIKDKVLSRTVVIIIVSTTILELGPTLLVMLLGRIANIQLASYIGPYSFTVSLANNTICSGLYSAACQRVFRPTSKSGSKVFPGIQLPTISK